MLKTRASLDPALFVGAVACVLALAGCGGGELAGQSSTVAATQQPATTPPATTQAPPANTTPRTTERPARTTTTPSTTPTQPPATTTPPTTTSTPSTTAREPKPEPPAEEGVFIDESAQLELVEKISAIEYRQRGTVTGTFDGEMTLHVKVGSYIYVDFTVDVPGGTVSGRGRATVQIVESELMPIAGTVKITGGTGKFAGIHGTGLTVKGKAALDGSRGTVRLSGTVYY